MEQTEEVEEYQDDYAPINQDEIKIEASDMDTKDRKNTNTIPRRVNAGRGVERLNIKFGGKKYDTQFTSTGKKRK